MITNGVGYTCGDDDDADLPWPPSSNYHSLSLSSHDVSYSCGTCGYELNLNSCNRNIPVIDAKYEKTMRRGVISFFSIDESRFTQVNKVRWLPYLSSKNSWRLFQRRTKLLCRNCGNYIGTAWMDDTSTNTTTATRFQMVRSSSAAWDGISARRTYEIKIRSLRPLSFERSALLV